jgi:hypothetical protein
MSSPEDPVKNFLQRWSQRKRGAETRAPQTGARDDTEPDPQQPRQSDANAPKRALDSAEGKAPACDPAALPPIESITAMSDIRAFLAPGVPEELTRAALRRVWVTDPAIRDFVGIAENQWDFTAADGVPGFGSLEPTPELRRMVARLFNAEPNETTRQYQEAQGDKQIHEAELPAPIGSCSGAPGSRSGRSPAAAELDRVIPQSNSDAAAQENVGEAGSGSQFARRKHGGAMPR